MTTNATASPDYTKPPILWGDVHTPAKKTLILFEDGAAFLQEPINEHHCHITALRPGLMGLDYSECLEQMRCTEIPQDIHSHI